MELEALRKDMVTAMKAKDKVTKEAVSALIAAVKKAAIDEPSISDYISFYFGAQQSHDCINDLRRKHPN